MRLSSLNSRAVFHFTNKNFFLVGLILSFLLFVQPCGVWAANYYVNPDTGVDIPENGTSKDPWKTITYAVANVEAGTKTVPNVITVASGTYDNTTNGETFPINFTRDFVHLIGAGAKSTIVDAESASVAMNINAKGISIAGFTFSNAADAIDISEGGFTISNNTFLPTIGDGVSLLRIETDYTSNISFPDMSITSNTFKTWQNGIYVYVELDFNVALTGLAATFGDLTISGNTLSLTSGDGIYISSLFDPTDITDGTVSVGDVSITDNFVTGGDGGIFFFSEVYNMENAQVTIGDLIVSSNTCNNLVYYGIEIDYWNLGYFSGTTAAVLGDLTVSGNTIQATDYATYGAADGINIIDIDYVEYMYDQTTVTTGSVNVIDNDINVDEVGIAFYSDGMMYLGEQLGSDSVAITTGPRVITGNTVTTNQHRGINLNLEYIGYYTYAASTVDYGSFTISNNTVNSGRAPLYINIYEAAYEMYDNSSVSMGDFTIDNNTLRSLGSNGSDGIYLEYDDYEVGSYMNENSTAILPDWTITNNIIDVVDNGNGLYFYSYSNPDDNTDNSTVKFGSMLIDNNTFNPNKDAGMDYGIYFYIEDVVENGYVSAAATFGDITITNNTLFNLNNDAVYLYFDEVGYAFSGAPTLTMGDVEIGNNTVDTAARGIYTEFYELYTEDHASVTIGGLDIHDNLIENVSEYGIYVYYYNWNNNETTAKLDIGAPSISGNTVNGKTASDSGIYLYMDNTSDNDPQAAVNIGMPSLTGNTVSGFGYGIYLDYLEYIEKIFFSCNYLENNSLAGMYFSDTDDMNITVSNNSFTGNTVGLSVANGNAAVINAERNWWGDKAGPVACASCNGVNPGDSGTVDYSPWLTYQPDKAKCGQSFPWLMFAPAITGMGK